jgi:peptidoglycan hydrolase-like protein with peptidoglycan-binding domain
VRRLAGRSALLATLLALALAACTSGGTGTTTSTTAPTSDTSATTSSTGTTPETTETSSTTTEATTTTLPSGPALAVEGDHNETVEAFQFLLDCDHYGDLDVDGAFGPATQTAVEAAQQSLGRQVTGEADDGLLADLSRACSERRRLEGEGQATVVGNAAPDDPEQFAMALLSGSILTASLSQGTGLEVTLTGPGGSEVTPQSALKWQIDASGDYLLAVASPSGPMTFILHLDITSAVRTTGDWILATDGVTYRGTKLALGSDAQTDIDKIFDFLGHEVRSAYGEFDTGWYSITDPADMGLRGIRIEGFAFLFYGPDPNNPARPETLARVRFLGGGADAHGVARPANYLTTAEGITVGDTLADLVDAYGSHVSAGSNSQEHYYRLADSHGELCFYFGADEPTDFSLITEIATQCRHD